MEHQILYAILHSRDRGESEKVHEVEGYTAVFSRDENTGLMVMPYAVEQNGEPEDKELIPVLEFFRKTLNPSKSQGVYVEIVDENEMHSRNNPSAMATIFVNMDEACVKDWANNNESKGSVAYQRIISLLTRIPGQTKKVKILRDKVVQLRREEVEAQKATGEEKPANENHSPAPTTPPKTSSVPDYADKENWVKFFAAKHQSGVSRNDLEELNGGKFSKADWNAIKEVGVAQKGEEDDSPPGQ